MICYRVTSAKTTQLWQAQLSEWYKSATSPTAEADPQSPLCEDNSVTSPAAVQDIQFDLHEDNVRRDSVEDQPDKGLGLN